MMQIFITVLLLFLMCCPLYGATFYVATNGNDNWSGKLLKPNASKTDGPFATFTRARDAVRLLKSSRGLTSPVTVEVKGGKYYLGQTFFLTSEDSGTQDCPITYRACSGEAAILSGGRNVIGWKPYKGKILQADLHEAKDGKWKFRQLFLNGERQARSRYPKVDPKVPLLSGWLFPEGSAEGTDAFTIKFKPGMLSGDRGKPSQGEITIFTGWRSGWCDNTVPIVSMDDSKGLIELSRAPYPGYGPPNRFAIWNLHEDLNQPGEWCVDYEAGKVYFWPPTGTLKAKDEVTIPVLGCLIGLHGSRWINISGFTFCETNDGDEDLRIGGEGYSAMFPSPDLQYVGEAIHINGAEHCLVEKNRFLSVGGNAIYLEGYNDRNIVGRNEIAFAGANGIVLIGTSDEHPVFNQIEDNHIHHVGRLHRYVAGIQLGVSDGNIISHNYLHHLPHHAVNLGSNGLGRNIVEYNEVRFADQEINDSGAINCWGDVPGRRERRGPSLIKRDVERSGHVIRYNLIVDTWGCTAEKGKIISPDEEGGARAIYLDDCTSNCFVYGNIIVRAPVGITVHNGKHNVVENNIIVDCKWGQYYGDWMSTRYGATEMAGFMKGNRFCRNIVYMSRPGTYLYQLSRGWSSKTVEQADYNIFFSSAGEPKVYVDNRPESQLDQNLFSKAEIRLSEWQEMGYDTHSVTADPIFVDSKKADYRLKPNSPAYKLGFQVIDVSKIGIRTREEF